MTTTETLKEALLRSEYIFLLFRCTGSSENKIGIIKTYHSKSAKYIAVIQVFKMRRKNVSLGHAQVMVRVSPHFCKSVRKSLNENFPNADESSGLREAEILCQWTFCCGNASGTLGMVKYSGSPAPTG